MTLTDHVLLDVLENHHLDRLMKHIEIKKPHYINLTSAARYDQAPDVIRRMRAHVPGIRVLWRGWKSEEWRDEGLWTRKTPLEWYKYRVEPLRKFLQDEKVILIADNESGTENAKAYAQWHAAAMELCASDGLQMAVLRTSTGTPAEDKYKDFEVAYRAMAKYGGILSPNEYESNYPPESAGNLERYMRHWEQFDRLGLPRPMTVVGEYAILRRIYEADKGYPTFGLSGKAYAQRTIATNERWYKPRGVWACHYSFGKWGDGMGVQDDEEFLTTIEAHYIAHPNPPIGAVSPTPVPPVPPVSDPPKPPPFNLQMLKVVYNDLLKAATRTRQMSLELAIISDDLLKDSQLLDAMIRANESKIP